MSAVAGQATNVGDLVNPTTGAPAEIPGDFGSHGSLTPEQRMNQIMAGLRPLLPTMLLPAFDRLIDIQHLSETSIDRFIEFADSLRYRPPAGIAEALERLRYATREIETVTENNPPALPVDHGLPSYEENERHVRPRVSSGHWRQRPVNEMTVDPEGSTSIM